VKSLVAWRILTHEKGRSGLAIGGILMAIVLMFLQLGFYTSVPRGGQLFYDAMRFDLLLTSSAYVQQAQSSTFPRRRLFQALALPEVLSANALYHGHGRWLNTEAGLAREIFVMGFKPRDAIFDLPEISRQVEAIKRPDTILIDIDSRPELGALNPGRQIEIEQRNVTVGGTYNLGIGFVGLGVAMTSDLNFIRMFPKRSLSEVNLGLLTLRPDASSDSVAARLREILPADTQVFTRAELANYESNYWTTVTSAGLVFGLGVVVAFVVGLVILNQTLFTQITRQLPQFATLKAMGYSDGYLGGVVVILAVMMSTMSYAPAAAISVVLYSMMRSATKLPIEMTAARIVAVLAVVWGMSALSALVALRVLRRADPVELF
jgi:putative ABC transport system permease protein